MSELYLLDASVTETNAIKLKFSDTNGTIKEVTGNRYKPYFLADLPLTSEDIAIVNYFSGETQIVEKTDLFTNEKRRLARISWPNVKSCVRASRRFVKCWEADIDFSKSYVYDNGFIFGALHSAYNLKPIMGTPAEITKEKLEKAFKDVYTSDPLKYAQILYWFSLLSQPIPSLSPDFFGVKDIDTEKVYWAWMLSRIANLPLKEAFLSHHVSKWLKSIMYTFLRRNGILIPTSEELRGGKPTHTVTGALTVPPKAGTYFNTVVCDFESLYASCIDSFNLSYETVDCGHAECSTNKISDFEGHVCIRQRGFYRMLIGALKDLRIKLFKPASRDSTLTEEERRTAIVAARLLKLILVSSYGVTVRIHGLASPPLAEAITGYGRYVLRESWRMAEESGLHPLYGDTDSLFLDNASDEQVDWLIKSVRERFRLDLAIEKRYSLCVLPKAKKAYFGILPDGTPDIKGVTAIKSNSPGYINRVFQRCVKELSDVRDKEGYIQAKKGINDLVRGAVEDLRNRRIGLEDLTYSVRLYFDPNEKIENMKTIAQPYQSALQLIDAGRTLEKGDTVRFAKVRPFRYKGRTFSVKPVDFLTSLAEINSDDYIRNLLTALSQTFEPMGIRLEKERRTEISQWMAS